MPGTIIDYEHTADVMYEVTADTLEELFEYAALGMFKYITDISRVKPIKEVSVEAKGFDLENLLYRWLEEFIIIHDVEGLVFSRFKVEKIERIREGDEDLYIVKGKAWGEKFDRSKHTPGVVVKAVTYSQMNIEKDSNGRWRVKIVLDI
jgi:SHS2 domain-containing protein